MKNTKWKYILRTLVVVSVLLSLLVSMNGCKKKPDTTESSSTGETTTETTGSAEDTQPGNATTQNTTPSENTDPSDVTDPTEETEDTCVHKLGNWIVETPSNCTKEGSRYKACSLCGKKVVTEAIAKTAHTESTWIDDKYEKASCTAQGKKYKKCTQCDELLYTIVVDKTNHKTYEVKGVGYTVGYRCSICHETIQEQYKLPGAGTVTHSNGKITGLGNWTGSELILPSTVDGKTVTAIDSEAFANCSSVKTVYIPKSVTKIGDKAFSGCSALTTIVYEGTMEEWVISVSKGDQWNQNTGDYKIHCNNRILSK